MSTIFCSGKLTALIGNLAPAKEATQPIEKLYGWNAHLFMLGGKKCILFMNKATYYVCFRLGVAKRDLANLSAFFRDCLVQQLKADQLLDWPFLQEWGDPAAEHKYYGPDNDKVMVGTINHVVQNIRYAYDGRRALSADLEVRYGRVYNEYPTGALKLKTPMYEIARLANGGVPVPPTPPKNPFGLSDDPNPEFRIAEPLSDIVRIGAEKILLQYCDDRIPDEYKDEIRLACRFEGDSAILSEQRPDWEGGPKWSDMAIIRFRYHKKTACWTVYWCDSHHAWHLCDDFEPNESLQELIDAVDDDDSARFWG